MRILCDSVETSLGIEDFPERFISICGWFIPKWAYYVYDTHAGVNTGHFFFDKKQAKGFCDTQCAAANDKTAFVVHQMTESVGGG